MAHTVTPPVTRPRRTGPGGLAPTAPHLSLVVDPAGGVPVYRQVGDQVRFAIASGLLQPGDELPSTRSLSAELSVNPMTVSKAWSLLVQDGLLERRPGLPLVVRDRPLRAAAQDRRAQLRLTLGRAAAAARLLGLAPGEALDVFDEMLREDGSGR